MRYCSPALASTSVPSKLTTVLTDVGPSAIRQMSEHVRQGGESWHTLPPTVTRCVQATPRSLGPSPAQTTPMASWQPPYRPPSHAAMPATFAERLQSVSAEPTRRLTSVNGGPTQQEGQSLNESSGIIYCPEECSMDLTLAAHVEVAYPASVPRFQAPVAVAPALCEGYVNWESLMTQAEALERAAEEQELLSQHEVPLESEPPNGEQAEPEDVPPADSPLVVRDQFPIPPKAILDDS
eukprot:Gregarina_sp_Pseudo_9__149@NODE_1100_length_1878_cov_35_642197_g1028_i0_p1_GENE_NODE_1100_length_1878_cov_35_642197_g1028_i0NODE_1100_length_1878_cov_35_642197_g1028_i0_p1_ORF_typecomplete_len238_score58_68Stb3/PF10330_9/0_25_NODE_1100_length_1878_cov_35_642197_g1028_i0200913